MSVFAPSMRRAAPIPSEKAGPVGPGAAVLLNTPSLYTGSAIFSTNPQKKMQQAVRLGRSVPWIHLAERIISGDCSSIGWHLEDGDEVEIDSKYPGVDAQRARLLIEKPQMNIAIGRKLTRRDLWNLTFRHMGLAGNAFWYLDQGDALADIPASILYIRPDRMTPAEDERGNLLGWLVDKTGTNRGIPLRLEEVIQFMMEPPDEGHFGTGLVESAVAKAQLTTGLDNHLQQVISSGGRLSGILAPKSDNTGTNIVEPEQFEQMIRDWRTVVEQPDAAKRLQIVRAPIDFTPTTMSPQDLQIRELMVQSRDDLLTLWGVPLSQVGAPIPGGLNSGETRKYDEAVLWQKANHPRLDVFREAIQVNLLDRWQDIGLTVNLLLHEPTFDDEAPKYEMLTKSKEAPLRNRERRAIIGLEPFGDDVIGPSGVPLDDEVWVPATIVGAASGATGQPEAQEQPEPEAEPRSLPEPPRQLTAGSRDAVTTVKAKPTQSGIERSFEALRKRLEDSVHPRVKRAVATVLREQASEIAERIRTRADHVARKPKDTSIWFDQKKWDRRLHDAMVGHLTTVAETVNAHIRETLDVAPAKAEPRTAVEYVLGRGAGRVTRINETTRDAIVELLATGLAQGSSIPDLADAIESNTNFDEYRAELVARTETMQAYNAAAIGTYEDSGITRVQAIDGDQDDECAARNGRIFTLEEAAGITDHPNGTLDWLPVIGKAADVPTAPAALVEVFEPDMTREQRVAKALSVVEQITKADADHDDQMTKVMLAFAQSLEILAARPQTPVIIGEGAVQVSVPAPIVTVEQPRPMNKAVIRDADGRIIEVREVPGEE